MQYYPVVVQACAITGFKVKAFFSDGRVTVYDVKPLLDKGVFRQLADVAVFSSALTVMNDTVAWDLTGKRDPCQCIDIDPVTIYNTAEPSPPLT